MKHKATPDDIFRVMAALQGGFWRKGRHIVLLDRIPARKIRAVAECTGDIISGQQGYKLLSAATPDEISAAIADLRSRARHIDNRADLIESQFNAYPITGDLFAA